MRNLHATKNRFSFAGSQTLLASDNEFNSTGNFNSMETVEDARRLDKSHINNSIFSVFTSGGKNLRK